MIEISYALRDHPYNIYMITDGVKEFPQFTQTFILRKKAVAADFLDDYFYLDTHSIKSNAGLTSIGKEIQQREWNNPYNFIAKVDSQVEFVVKRRVFECLQGGFLSIWNPDFYLSYLENQPSAFLIFLRVYRVEKPIPERYLSKGRQGSSLIIRLYDFDQDNISISTNIIEPLIPNNHFEYIKDEVIHLLKTENAFIACYGNDENGRIQLQKKIEAEFLFRTQRDYEYDPDLLIDRAKIDYEGIYNNIIAIEPTLESFVDYVSQILPPQINEADNLIRKAKSGDCYARERIIEMFMRVVLKNALWAHRRYGVDVDGAIQEASIGLMIAIQKYDLNNDNKFSTYAPWWIRQNMLRELPIGERTVRIPSHYRDKLLPIIDLADSHECYVCRPGYFCSEIVKKVMETAGCDQAAALTYLQYTQWPESIECLVEEEDESLVDSESENLLLDNILYSELPGQIKKVLSTLRPREVEVLLYRFGFNSEPMTLEEIGLIFNVTRERIRQIEAKAIKKLRVHSRANRIKPYYDML